MTADIALGNLAVRALNPRTSSLAKVAKCVDTDAVKAAEDKQADASSGTETLSVEDVDVEELNTETEVIEEEDGIDVATADEDPLDNLLNTVAQFRVALKTTDLSLLGAWSTWSKRRNHDPSSFTRLHCTSEVRYGHEHP